MALLLASLAAYGVAAAALKPVEAMRARAAEISAAEPDQRLPVPPSRRRDRAPRHHPERDARTTGGGARARAGLRRRRQPRAAHAAGDPAHRAGAGPGGGPLAARSCATALASAAEETDRLTQLSEDLLTIAQTERGELPLKLSAVELVEILEGVAAALRSRGPRRPVGRSRSTVPSATRDRRRPPAPRSGDREHGRQRPALRRRARSTSAFGRSGTRRRDPRPRPGRGIPREVPRPRLRALQPRLVEQARRRQRPRAGDRADRRPRPRWRGPRRQPRSGRRRLARSAASPRRRRLQFRVARSSTPGDPADAPSAEDQQEAGGQAGEAEDGGAEGKAEQADTSSGKDLPEGLNDQPDGPGQEAGG